MVRFLTGRESSPQVFEKIKNIKYHDNLSSGSHVPLLVRTDRHDDANSHILKLRTGLKIIRTVHQLPLDRHLRTGIALNSNKVNDKNIFCNIIERRYFNSLRPHLTYTGCPRRNVPDFGRVFLMLKYTDITQNTLVQS